MTTARDLSHQPRGPLRLIVLDDDPIFRTVLNRMLTRAGVDVLATCASIDAAKARIEKGDVEAVTVDVVLRNESGLDFLRWCRATYPSVMTVLVTAGTEKGARTGVDGMLLGATALLTKPSAGTLSEFENELKRTFEHRTGPSLSNRETTARVVVPPAGPPLRPKVRRELLAIGASTGGPPALLKLIKAMPPWFDAPIVITQHMPSLHLTYFAQLLAGQCPRPVTIVAGAQPLEKGTVYLAGSDRHLEVVRTAHGLMTQPLAAPPEHHCRPAVDPMFRSIAVACKGTAVAVVLTGMGSDGARAAAEVRAAGNPVLVQDQASSVVWGMPAAVMNTGNADAVVALERMPNSILEWMAWTSGGSR